MYFFTSDAGSTTFCPINPSRRRATSRESMTLAPVFVAPVAASHFGLVFLRCLLDVTTDAQPVHRLSISDRSVVS